MSVVEAATDCIMVMFPSCLLALPPFVLRCTRLLMVSFLSRGTLHRGTCSCPCALLLPSLLSPYLPPVALIRLHTNQLSYLHDKEVNNGKDKPYVHADAIMGVMGGQGGQVAPS